jgi:hypothetical protein
MKKAGRFQTFIQRSERGIAKGYSPGPLPAMKVQQELMRHASIQTTIDVYGQSMNDSKRDANSKVVGLALGAERTATG